jgi:hypothetical protein
MMNILSFAMILSRHFELGVGLSMQGERVLDAKTA